jgi:peptidoglycan/xylan/chitin deacetylase (PgdA/CDA1 family)
MPALSRPRHAIRALLDRTRPLILVYHRVARLEHDPWQLAVAPDRFAEQIEVLTRERQIVPLRRLAAEVARGRMPRRLAAVTFDDGYADVLTAAAPVLERFDCPATLFVTTGAIGSQESFWWDALIRILLGSPRLPPVLAIRVAGREHHWELDPGTEAPVATVVSPRALHDKLHALLRPLPVCERRRTLRVLAEWAGIGPPRADPTLSADELRKLADDGLIEIGAHSVTHPSLPLLGRAQKRAEVLGSRRAGAALVGRPIESFAYPFGDYDDECIDVAAEAGFSVACTVEPRAVRPGDTCLRLPRVTVGDWDGGRFADYLAVGFPEVAPVV